MSIVETTFFPFQVKIQRPKCCSDNANCSQIAAFILSPFRPIFWPQQKINTLGDKTTCGVQDKIISLLVIVGINKITYLSPNYKI